MMDQREEQQERLHEKLEQRAYREATENAAKELSELLQATVTIEDALSRSAVEAARASYLEQEQFHLVWRRVWGVHLRAEMHEVARRVGDARPGPATLIWVCWNLETKPVRAIPVAFKVEAQVALMQLPRHLGPPAGEVGPGGAGSDVLLVSDDGRSGVHLDYQHHGDRDEYEMLVWGEFAQPVIP
jgi:hypothetical protein